MFSAIRNLIGYISIMVFFDELQISSLFDYKEFVKYLRDFLKKKVNVPIRPHYKLSDENSMLAMPAWLDETYAGMKVVNVFPQNKDQPSINGIYNLFSMETGLALAQFDALAITVRRTAAMSVLAAMEMKAKKTSHLIMGTGSLSSSYAQAYTAILGVAKTTIWGRDKEKVAMMINHLKSMKISARPSMKIDKEIGDSDIISTLTRADKPILKGELLSKSTHVDLVGSYLPNCREADDALIIGKRIVVDTENAIEESGDLKIPLRSGVITKSNIEGDLKDIINKGFKRNKDEITVYKSVGTASADLAIASYLYEKYNG